MAAALRNVTFAIPFACLVAIATHAVRFGDEHAFGGTANEALVSAAISGSIVIALAILHAFLAGNSTIMTGTVAAERVRKLIPGPLTLFVLAASAYYGIEALEGNGVEIGSPTLVLALFAILLVCALRGLAGVVAHFVADIIREWLAMLDRRERLVAHISCERQPMHSQTVRIARRFGRAPPNGQRFA